LSEQEIEPIQRASKYSFPPNVLGYCGPEQSWKTFQKLFKETTEENALEAKNLLKEFNSVQCYLELIAKENGKKPFDADVIEAYWIGNGLLEKVHFRELQKTVLSFQKFGLPRSIAEEKASGLPKSIQASHSMHVLYVNFVTKKVEPIVKNLSSCLVQWALVKENTEKGARVKGIELFTEGKELKLREKEKTIQNPFALELLPGDFITVHWNSAVEKISPQQLKNLKKYTEKNLEAIQ